MLHYIKKSYISGQSAKLYLYSAHEKPVKYAKEVEAILKRISVKFQQQEQTYRSLHAAARSLLSSKGRVFLLFLLFYKVLTNFLFVPALQLIWALTLRFAPIQYLNNKTASRTFASPAIIGCIVVLAVLAAFWSLYEVAAMLQLLTRVRHGEPLRVGAVFRDAFCSLVRVFLPQNLPLLLYGAALIPLTNFFLAANHLTQFAVPEYLWGLLKARAANRLLFALAVLFVLALLLDGLVVLPKFLLERKNFGCAFAESLRVLRGRAGQLFALALRWMLTAAVRTGLMLLCGALLFYCVILGVGFASTAALLALSRAALLIELPFLCMLMDCAMTAAQSTLTEALYEVTRQSDAAQPIICSASPAPHREQTVLAGMMACAALVTCGVAAVYLLFPQTQPLQSVLGLSDPVITYHRGYSSRAPENTMAAFETALEHGSPRIELDVQMTADGVAVVTHDTSLRRCTGCNANIYDLPYARVQQLDAGRWFHRQFTGSYIPTLEEVLALCKGRTEH
jgi:glycerophosphoryl diester phosphodiesterase